MANIIFELILALALIGAYIYNEKTGTITEFERQVWNDICGIINRWIRKYEKRRATR